MNKTKHCQYDLYYRVQESKKDANKKTKNPVQEKEEMELFRKMTFFLILSFIRIIKLIV
jgi:hypothetical protein